MEADRDDGRLKRQVLKAFQMRAVTLGKGILFAWDESRDGFRSALEHAVQFLLERGAEEREQWLNKLTGLLSTRKLPKIATPIDRRVGECGYVIEIPASTVSCAHLGPLITVIDLFSAPRLRYDDERKILVQVKGAASAIGKSDDLKHLYRNRLKLVIQV
ncbi:unnamed protein product [Gongylonema pulchrum]|uniref:DUF1767 domain-containing protein n=1 Tax=Gongylonema pulchrum TaxID=637853 RepID=A0A183EFE2_9BILA|nr:unnamed protein product [Gongylonema pulchrum]